MDASRDQRHRWNTNPMLKCYGDGNKVQDQGAARADSSSSAKYRSISTAYKKGLAGEPNNDFSHTGRVPSAMKAAC
jgi:hypothetical protein